ncbi:MAG: dephospho-CoA kinase [Firmicutes bacterium]|nr:dephospho-CoA kinase [Bacillota bacterium]
MVKIGLTGGIATGKSTVGRLLRQKGVVVVSSDELVHQAMAPDGAAYHRIVAEFGPEILAADGEINRRFLGTIVFKDDAARHKLEQIVHPIVIKEIRDSFEGYLKQGVPIVVVEVPLLFEVGWIDLFDQIWVVSSSLDHQLQRIYARDGLAEEDARERIATQLQLEEKENRADVVINNNNGLDSLEEQVSLLLRTLE